MMKIPIITQNFSSPDVFNSTPLMLLPQVPPPSTSDRDQDGFSQLLLHDLHRHRQSYVRSYTAFETLRKRQDFVLRQENLRSLVNFQQRIHTKQEQLIDQSVHSYEQCFVKVINGNLTPHGSLQEQQKRVKSGPPSFEKPHLHQVLHVPTTSIDHPPVSPYQRYQKSHRPPKYRNQTSLHHSAQSYQDAFQSPSFSNQNQPFVTFTESYLQKYGDRSPDKYHFTTDNDEMDEIREIEEGDDGENEEQIRSISVEPHLLTNQNKKQEHKSKPSDVQHTQTTISPRNTNTPLSTPRISYYDTTRHGRTIAKDNQNPNNKTSVIVNEKRRSSIQSTSQISNSGSKTSTKRSKTNKKKQAVVDLTSDKKSETMTSKTADNDLLKSAMFVQNYETNTAVQNVPEKIERIQIPVNTNRKIPSAVRRASIKSSDSNLGKKSTLGDIATQMTTTAAIEQSNIEATNEQNLVSTTDATTETKQDLSDPPSRLEFVDNRKRIKKGAFDASESVNDFVAFELGLMANSRSAMKKNRFRLGKENNQNGEETEAYPENQATLDLLEKIRQSASGLAIGKPPLSQQGCRFELPLDLKLLEDLTPLEYLSKYCRLSSRRNYQFKRTFDKYRNNQFRFESSNLYSSIVDVHTESFTSSQYDYLCQLIDLGNEQHQFTFDTFAGILALCERLLYESSRFRADGADEYDLAKDAIEKCDFDSLERKFDGLKIKETMKRLLKTI